MYPKTIQYQFTQGEKSVSYKIAQQYELESRDAASGLPKLIVSGMKLKGLRPSTSRNFATGTMTYDDGKEKVTRAGDMIHEFVYMGLTVKEKMENR